MPYFDNLKVFDATNNHFVGNVPSFNFMVSLKVLRLGSNQLSGAIPEALLLESSMVLSELDLSPNLLEENVRVKGRFGKDGIQCLAIDILLDELERMGRFKPQIKFLRTFLRCAEILLSLELELDENKGSDLLSFLINIEDAAQKILSKFHENPYGAESAAVDILFYPFPGEIHEFFFKLSNLSSKSRPPRRVKLVGFMDFLLGNLGDLKRDGPLDLLESLEEKFAFFKNLTRFATLRGVEDGELDNLLIHARSMAVDATCLAFHYWTRALHKPRCDELVEKIKQVDAEVRQTYIQVLMASNLSGSSHSINPAVDEQIVEEFLDSLQRDLWELLNHNTNFTATVNDRMQKLYEDLTFLRNFLRVKRTQFIELREGVKDHIENVINEAGIVICTSFVNEVNEMNEKLAEQMDLALSDLLEKINHTKVEVVKQYPRTSTYSFPRTNEMGFLDFFLENLKELESYKADSISFAKNQIETVREDIIFLRSFLEIVVEKRNQHEKIKTLWNRAMQVTYKAEIVIDSLVVKYCTPVLLETITEEMKFIKAEALEICDSKTHDKAVQKVTNTDSHMTSYHSNPRSNQAVVGFNEEAALLIDQLTRGTSQLDIVTIVGMPGLGKTTLALKVYNNLSIVSHFHPKAWGYVSQVYSKKNLLLGLLDCFDSDKKFEMNKDEPTKGKKFEMNEDDLAEMLFKCLKGRRYLIVLDDLWDIAVWNDLKIVFPNDSNGSRILLTSRLSSVALQVKPDRRPFTLEPLTDDNSWELLRKKLFQEEGCPPELCKLGMQITKDCKGVPLTIVIVAGILATRREQDGWKEVAESLSSGFVCHTKEGMTTIELSYKNLPDYLKPCFLYFGAFPEGQEIPIQKLIWLWLAEGFVQQKELKNLENVAEEYMKDLIDRSLVIVSRQTSTGEVKSCRIHDLLHEFCVTKAKEESFLQVLHSNDEHFDFNEPSNLRRLCIYSMPEHFKKSRLCCPQVRSLLFSNYGCKQSIRACYILFIFRIFKLLRVLDLGDSILDISFPDEIELLVHLRYLAISGFMTSIPSSIPSSIVQLSNLQTIILDGYLSGISLPDTIWSMKKLRHIHCARGHFLLPSDNLQNSSPLYNLDFFCTLRLSLGSNMGNIMRNFPNIRTLGCLIPETRETGLGILDLEFLSRLESLVLSLHGWRVFWDIDIWFPMNLKKLTLDNLKQPWSKISRIGALPNLEVLELLSQACVGEVWEMREGEFPKLEFLKLYSLDIVRWTTDSDDNFACLQKLVLHCCRRLTEIPSCLWCIATLEMIEVWRCTESVASSVEEIQEEQINMGNDSLKVLIL